MWQIKAIDNKALTEFTQATGLNEPWARILYLRDIRTPSAVQRFLKPKLSDLYPAFDLPDVEPALDRIVTAIKNKERILIWGHEDLDGITSVVMLDEVLRDLQADVIYYIPPKHIEKHGLSSEKIKNFNDPKIKLVITVDCGITNFKEVEDLANFGIDTIILEHHEVLDRLPKALANIDPKRPDSKYPFRYLAAVGVVLKFLMALTEKLLRLKPDEFLAIKSDFLGLTAIGTIADRVPLREENRILVKYGLAELKNSKRLAIKILLAEEQLATDDLTVDKFLANILPLFASANGQEACHFFKSQDRAAIEKWLKTLAHERDIWREEAKYALAVAKENLDLTAELVIVKSDKLPLRAMGHCASKLREQYQVPAIVIGKGNDNWIGECRGVDQVNLVDLLKANHQYFIDFGGHKKACGFSITQENLDAFIQSAKDYARQNFAGKFKPEPILADAILPLAELTKEYTELGPFGEGNPAPLLISPDTPIEWHENGLTTPINPALKLYNNSESSQRWEGNFDLLYTFDEHLNIYIKQAIAK
ncbi:MAG: DHH family phosphoesterase [candidate division WOR-3 bacterium]